MESAQRKMIIVTGFGEKGATELKAKLAERVGCEISIFPGCPANKANELPDVLIQAIREEIRGKTITAAIDVIGDSYGGALALGAVLEEKFRGIEHLILIDAPLRQDVEVLPPDNGKFDRFQVQYENRVRVARMCYALLTDLQPVGRILTIGTQEDPIVPPAAKQLRDLNFPHIWLSSEYSGHDLRKNIDGIVHHILAFLQR